MKHTNPKTLYLFIASLALSFGSAAKDRFQGGSFSVNMAKKF